MRCSAALFFLAVSLAGQVLPIGGIPSVNAGTFSLLHVTTPATTAACSLTCTVTVTSTTAGTLQVLTAISTDSNQAWVNAVTGAGNWSCPIMDNLGGTGSISGCYNPSSMAGVTTLTLTSTVSGDTFIVRQWEYSFSGGPASLDWPATNANLTASTSQTGITSTLGGSKDVIIQWAMSSPAGATSVSGGYGNFAGSGIASFADLENTASGAAPSWTTAGTQTSMVASMAFRLGPRNFTILQTTCVGDQNGTLSGSVSCTWSPFAPAAGSSLVCGGLTWNGGSAVTGLSISDGTVFTNSQAARIYNGSNNWILLSFRFNIGVTAPATVTLTISGTDMFANLVCNAFKDNSGGGTPSTDGTCTFGTSSTTAGFVSCTSAIVTTSADYVIALGASTSTFPTQPQGFGMGAHVKGAITGVRIQNAAGSITPSMSVVGGQSAGINGLALEQ